MSMLEPASPEPTPRLIATVDLWQLGSRTRWPILRALAPRFVERLALAQYERELLATHRWSLIRVVPRREPGAPATHQVDIFGQLAG
jgi:hypothetical protein